MQQLLQQVPILFEDLLLKKFGGIFHRNDYILHNYPNMMKCKHSCDLKVEELFKMPINKTKIPDTYLKVQIQVSKKMIQFQKH